MGPQVWPLGCFKGGREEAELTKGRSKAMKEMEKYDSDSHSSGTKWKVVGAFLFGAVLLGNIFLLSKVRKLEDQADTERTVLRAEIAKLQESIAVESGDQARKLREMRKDLDETSKTAVSRARSEAQRQTKRVEKLIGEKQREQQEMLLDQLGGLDSATKTNSDSIETVKGTVDGVQSAVDENSTRLGETAVALEATSSELRGALDGVGGDMDRYAAAIDALRMKGERDVTSFVLAKSRTRKKVQDIQVRLRNTDVSKGRYTLEVMADDRTFVQKDRYVNQPVEFYVIGASQPYEIVVTSVKKDQIVGYLATPKTQQLAQR